MHVDCSYRQTDWQVFRKKHKLLQISDFCGNGNRSVWCIIEYSISCTEITSAEEIIRKIIIRIKKIWSR